MQPLVGVSGYAQVGKDTFAGFLAELGWERIAFADAVRDVLYQLNPLVPVTEVERDVMRVQEIVNDIGWDRAKTSFTEIRELLQRLGTEAGRHVLGWDIWVQVAEEKIEAAGSPIVLTDVRFSNEADLVRRRGGKLVRLRRPGVGPANAHASENSLSDEDADVIVENDGSLDDLRATARTFISEQVGELGAVA